MKCKEVSETVDFWLRNSYIRGLYDLVECGCTMKYKEMRNQSEVEMYLHIYVDDMLSDPGIES